MNPWGPTEHLGHQILVRWIEQPCGQSLLATDLSLYVPLFWVQATHTHQSDSPSIVQPWRALVLGSKNRASWEYQFCTLSGRPVFTHAHLLKARPSLGPWRAAVIKLHCIHRDTIRIKKNVVPFSGALSCQFLFSQTESEPRTWNFSPPSFNALVITNLIS